MAWILLRRHEGALCLAIPKTYSGGDLEEVVCPESQTRGLRTEAAPESDVSPVIQNFVSGSFFLFSALLRMYLSFLDVPVLSQRYPSDHQHGQTESLSDTRPWVWEETFRLLSCSHLVGHIFRRCAASGCAEPAQLSSAPVPCYQPHSPESVPSPPTLHLFTVARDRLAGWVTRSCHSVS